MWLIDVQYLTLKEFNAEESRPPYAILSHTWGDEEVSHQQILQHEWTTPDTVVPETIPLNWHSRGMVEGWTKIVQTCALAAKDGISWAWVDTCCIDKKSSAELSEAINSMFRWYQEAQVCYVYLSDVNFVESMTKSRWFTRGWTLQELIAPSHVRFYDHNWGLLGGRADFAMDIHQRTSIDIGLLGRQGPAPLSEFSVAQRMSWAVGRRTTRIEDRAYSLLGIFQVNMPLLYGEHSNAFARLQEEIIRTSVDQSIFAWNRSGLYIWPDSFLLADDPDSFANCSNIVASRDPFMRSESYELNNLGIRISVLLWKGRFAILTCGRSGEPCPMALELEPAMGLTDAFYCTVDTLSELPGHAPEQASRKTITILRSPEYFHKGNFKRGRTNALGKTVLHFSLLSAALDSDETRLRISTSRFGSHGDTGVAGLPGWRFWHEDVSNHAFFPISQRDLQVFGVTLKAETQPELGPRLATSCHVIAVVNSVGPVPRAAVFLDPAQPSLEDTCVSRLVRSAGDVANGAHTARMQHSGLEEGEICANLIFKPMINKRVVTVEMSLE